jgi:hypothetical protein
MDGRTAAVVLVILGTVYLSYLIDGYSRWLREQKAQDRQTQRDLEEFDRIIARWDAEAKAEESAPAVTQRSPAGAPAGYV